MQDITSVGEWERVREHSFSKPVIIYKHSLTCGACNRSLRELTEGLAYGEIKSPVYRITVQEARDVSARISADLRVAHESPQVIIVHRGRACFVADHSMIDIPTLSMHVDIITKTHDELFVHE